MNETTEMMKQGQDQAQAMFDQLSERHPGELVINILRDRVVSKAASLNPAGASLQGFLSDTAHLTGFADRVRDLAEEALTNASERSEG